LTSAKHREKGLRQGDLRELGVGELMTIGIGGRKIERAR